MAVSFVISAYVLAAAPSNVNNTITLKSPNNKTLDDLKYLMYGINFKAKFGDLRLQTS